MATWTIYSKEGVAKCTVKHLEYSGEWMSECFVTVKIESPEPIRLAIGDYFDYRGERFYLNYDPTVSKTARKYSYGKAFTYDGIKFNNASDELTRCSFLDTVVGDNQQHYTALPTFSFFASSVNALAERIQANLDRVYTEADGNKWTVSVAEDFTGETDVNVEVNNITVWGALELCVSLFNANFIIRGRTITIGAAGIPAANVFKYGKGNGLRSIERTAEQDQQVITRLRAYGSTRNLPARYYHEKSGGTLPGTLAVDRLMLPGFPEETFDPYLDSKNISALGIREATIFFDGTDGREEIYPTLEGMTDSEGNRIDQVVDAEQITDNGVPPETSEEQEAMQSTFTVTLRDLGFDLNDHLSEGQTAILTMQSGMCASREFEITECVKEGSGYKLTCLRQLDEALNLYFPYKDYNIKAGDEFTFAGIDLPDVYIEQASQRLKTAAQKFLSKNDYVRYSYTPEVDNLYMARQHDQAMQSGGLIKSLHDTLKEGDILLFEDDDLGIDASVVIDQLVIKEGGKVPEYTITLRDEKTVGTLERMQQQIDSIANGFGGGGYNAQQIKELIQAYGKNLFLSKINPDTASGLINFLSGSNFGKYLEGQTGGRISPSGIAELLDIILRGDLKSINFSTGALGAGYFLGVDDNGDSYLEVDRMLVRKVAYFVELVIQRMSHVGGQIVLTPASMKCSKVEEHDTFYRCYFENTDGDKTITNDFVAGDQARCQTFNVKPGVNQNVSNTYYWRLVVAVGDDYIDLSKTDCDAGSTVPQADDEIVLLGNRTDATRQSAIVLASYGNDAPYFKLYRGINSYQLDGKEFLSFSHSQIKIIADELLFSTGESVSTVINGVKEEVTTVKTEISGVKKDLTNTKTELQGKIDGVQQQITDAVDDLSDTLDLVNALSDDLEAVKNQADGAIETWFYDPVPTLSNAPANQWTDEATKKVHLGDLYYSGEGKTYRFQLIDGAYGWKAIADTDITLALQKAEKAQDTADGKRRVFVTQPTNASAYDVGDLWVNATYGNYSNELLRCKTAKAANAAWSINHWEKASKYTDDTAANQAIADAATAQSAANAAQESANQAAEAAADAAQDAADAQQDATDAKNRLDDWAADSVISPTEKQGLKDEIARIDGDKSEITQNYTKYGLGTPTAYNTAHSNYRAVLVSLSAATPETIAIPSDFSTKQSAYYTARTNALTAIAAAAKTAADNAQDAADAAQGAADNAMDKALEAGEKIDNLKLGTKNLVSRKMMLKWNEKNSNIAVWGQDDNGVYLGINHALLYENISGNSNTNPKDIFLGEGSYKANTQYVLSVEWRLAAVQTAQGLDFYVNYTDGTQSHVRIEKYQNTKTRSDLITAKGKTIQKIWSAYGVSQHRTLIYALSLVEGNTPPVEIPTAEEDIWRSEVNLVDGGEEVTVQTAGSGTAADNSVFKHLTIPLLKPNTVYTVSIEGIKLLKGKPTGFSIGIYNTQASEAFANLVVLTLSNKSAIIITRNNFTAGKYLLLLYAGIAGATSGVAVKYTGISLVEGFYPPTAWRPSQGDLDKEIQEVSNALTNLDTTINGAFKDGIINEAEAKAIASNINILNAEKKDVDAQYTELYGNTYLTGTAKTNLQSAKTAYNTAHTNLINAINTAIADKEVTAAEKSNVDSKFTAYGTALGTYKTRVEEANKAIQDELNRQAQEKVDAVQIGVRNLLLKSNVELAAQAYNLGNYRYSESPIVGKEYTLVVCYTISGSSSINAYNNWGSGIHLVFNTKGERVIESKKFDISVENAEAVGFYQFPNGTYGSKVHWAILVEGNKAPMQWIAAPEDLTAAIEEAKDAADAASQAASDAQEDATEAKSELANINSDSIVSPPEKPALRQQQADIQAEYQEIIADASRYGISTSAYTSAYNLANTALTKYTANSPVYISAGSDYANISAYYDARQTILNNIAAAAKQELTDAKEAAEEEAELAKWRAIGYSWAGGKMISKDPTFKDGINSVYAYNNSNNGAVVVTRESKQSDSPVSESGYNMKITSTAQVNPGLGGFFHAATTRASAVFVFRILAKIPQGYYIYFASNSIGTGGGYTIVTPNAGTGKFEEYIFVVKCGASGSFSTTGFFYLSGTAPVTWYVAYAGAFDVTAGVSQADVVSATVTQLSSQVESDKEHYLSEFQRIDTEVSAIPEATKEQIEDAVVNLRKGMRNLILGGYANIPTDGNDNRGYNYNVINFDLSKALVAGNKYTIVAKATLRGNQSLCIYDHAAQNRQATFIASDFTGGVSKAGVFSYNPYSSVTNHARIRIYNYPSSTASANPMDLEWVCLYEGDITDTAPDYFVNAPEDLNLEIDSVKTSVSDIEQRANSITLRVETTEENVTKAQSTANSAQSAANTAKSAADNAQDAADAASQKADTNLATAKSYAETQADNALSNAKGYADTKKSEAISAAASDATSKANQAKTDAINDAKEYTDGRTRPMWKGWVDASALDQDTYYPVTIVIPSSSRTRIMVNNGLAYNCKPDWSTHGGGFSVRCTWESIGEGWGINNGVSREVFEYSRYWTANETVTIDGEPVTRAVHPIASLGQMTHSSNEYVYVRGGGQYYFTIEGTSNAPVLHSSAYTASSQTIEPKTPEEIAIIEVTGVTKTELTSELEVLNDEISARVTKTDFNAQNEVVGEQIGQLTTSYNAISGTVTEHNNILGTYDKSGFVTQSNFTTIFAERKNDLGETIASSINVAPDGITLDTNKVTFTDKTGANKMVVFGKGLYEPLGLDFDTLASNGIRVNAIADGATEVININDVFKVSSRGDFIFGDRSSGNYIEYYAGGKMGTSAASTSIPAQFIINVDSLNIKGGSINFNNGVFKVDSTGKLTATNADIRGKITASTLIATEGGTIGDFTINGSRLEGSKVMLTGSMISFVYDNNEVYVGGNPAMAPSVGSNITTLGEFKLANAPEPYERGDKIALMACAPTGRDAQLALLTTGNVRMMNLYANTANGASSTYRKLGMLMADTGQNVNGWCYLRVYTG